VLESFTVAHALLEGHGRRDQTPFFARFPREIKPGSVCNDLISNVDFAPTFLDLAGVSVPSYMQGRSTRPLLQGETPSDWPGVAYHRYWMHQDEYHNAFAHYGIRDQRYKLIYWYNQGFGLPGTQSGGQAPEWEFFDCEKDPLELFNCYRDPAYQAQVARMMGLLEDKMLEIGDDMLHNPR
jgi:arylsulfatase A-like enzyme